MPSVSSVGAGCGSTFVLGWPVATRCYFYDMRHCVYDRRTISDLRLLRVSVRQYGFYARERLRYWGIVWFAGSSAPLSRSGLPRRGHRFFGSVDSFW